MNDTHTTRIHQTHAPPPAAPLLVALALLMACSKDEPSPVTPAPSAEAPAKPKAQLPAPFEALRLGDSRESVSKAFPPAEDTASCAPHLVGGDDKMPAAVPGTENKPRSYCARSGDLAGLTKAELTKLLAGATDIAASDTAALEVMVAMEYAVAQVRGSLRAGTLDDALVFNTSGTSKTAYEAVLHTAAKLFDGSSTFVRPKNSRRVIGATFKEDCSGVDPSRVRDYVLGKYSLATIDADARKRVAYSACRGPFVQGESGFKRAFVAHTGALAGIGLARATQKDGKLDPEKPTSFATYSGRSGLDGKTAQLGVRIANGLTDTEKFWKGAVALDPGEQKEPTWASAVVWFTAGKVSRVLVNVHDEGELGVLADELTKLYGKPASVKGTVTRWKVDGVVIVLDIGGAVSLTLSSDD